MGCLLWAGYCFFSPLYKSNITSIFIRSIPCILIIQKNHHLRIIIAWFKEGTSNQPETPIGSWGKQDLNINYHQTSTHIPLVDIKISPSLSIVGESSNPIHLIDQLHSKDSSSKHHIHFPYPMEYSRSPVNIPYEYSSMDPTQCIDVLFPLVGWLIERFVPFNSQLMIDGIQAPPI